MTDIATRLRDLDLTLPDLPALDFTPNRSLVTVHGDVAYVSGVGAIGVRGRVDADLTVEGGYAAARLAGLFCLSRLTQALGNLDRIERWLKVVGFVRSSAGFADQPGVLNGFSDLMVAIWDDAGRCARSAIGVSELPMNMPIEIEAVLALR
jgi:enamine deaminase RidA (YjgF/YER057c/UK114 family)